VLVLVLVLVIVIEFSSRAALIKKMDSATLPVGYAQNDKKQYRYHPVRIMTGKGKTVILREVAGSQRR